MQQFDTYDTLNPIQISVKSNAIIADLNRYKHHKCQFWVDNLLFSSATTNNTNVILIMCNGLNEAKRALINGKLHKILDVINLDQMRNMDLIKGESE